jgi:sugar porter (SP) family MFS transporter
VTDTRVAAGSTSRANTGYAIFISLVAAMSGLLFGYDLVIISGTQIFLKNHFSLSPGQLGFAVSSALLGCIAGPSLGAWLCDRKGRKTTLVIAGCLFAAGAVGTALASSITTFNLFRIGGGIGVGVSSLAAPLYIAEVAPKRWRGRLGFMYQLTITIGALAATLVAYFLARYVAPDLCWRLMLASVLIPVAGFMILLVRLPQAPRWLAESGRYAEALSILSRIDGEEEAVKEMEEIRNSLAEETGTLGELLQPGIRMALFVGIVLALFNNWTGWTGVSYYLPMLFQQSGYPEASAAIGADVFVWAGMVILTAVSGSLVDRFGRRPIWLAASVSMVICLVSAGWLFQLHVRGAWSIFAIFLCAAPHSMGFGPLPWLMMSELFPTRIRARAVSITTTCLWIAGFTSPFAFPVIEAASRRLLGTVAGVFWFYAVVCVVSFVWALKFLPETKGRSLEDIARSWEGGS